MKSKYLAWEVKRGEGRETMTFNSYNSQQTYEQIHMLSKFLLMIATFFINFVESKSRISVLVRGFCLFAYLLNGSLRHKLCNQRKKSNSSKKLESLKYFDIYLWLANKYSPKNEAHQKETVVRISIFHYQTANTTTPKEPNQKFAITTQVAAHTITAFIFWVFKVIRREGDNSQKSIYKSHDKLFKRVWSLTILYYFE